MIDVCLPLLPYARIESPSLALGLLKSALTSAGLSSRVLYSNLAFADAIGIHNYGTLSFEFSTLMGEWTFSSLAFPEVDEDPEPYFAFVRSIPHTSVEPGPALLEIRRRAGLFLADLVAEILALEPRIVSCSSTFQQHAASLALLRMLKAQRPEIVTVIGGANCEGVMGMATLQSFPWIDYVMSGEGDLVFAEACRLICVQAPAAVPQQQLPLGVFGPDCRSQPTAPVRSSVVDLDRSPVPDFDDYFDALQQRSWQGLVNPGLPIEASRGCWWGAKVHCRFCGLNGEGMAFRRKSGPRLLRELSHLVNRYGDYGFGFVDNILAPEYFNELLTGDQPLFDGQRCYFFEVKANLTRPQLEQMERAGIRWIQPGIESLHDGALQEMRKGTTAAINIQLLKWCRELGIRVSWNILTGFPGEQGAWLEQMGEMLPLLHHLQPPSGVMLIQFHRFSPYHAQAAEFGLQLQATQAYRYVYPLKQEMLDQLAYAFDAIAPSEPFYGYYRSPAGMPLRQAVERWQQLFQRAYRPMLCQQQLPDGRLLVVDTRACRTAAKHVLEGLRREILLCCEPHLPRRQLARQLKAGGADHKATAIDAAVEGLIADRLLIDCHGSLLSLPLRGQVPRLIPEDSYPGGAVVRSSPQAIAYRQPLELQFRQLTAV
jgi:ribosomal peptide maturation radical SAM protein 1